MFFRIWQRLSELLSSRPLVAEKAAVTHSEEMGHTPPDEFGWC